MKHQPGSAQLHQGRWACAGLLCVAIALAVGPAASPMQSQPQAQLSEVVFAPIPIPQGVLAAVFGTYRLEIVTDGHSVTAVQTNPSDVLGNFLAEVIGRWRFSGAPGKVDLILRHLKSQSGPCEREGLKVNARFPTEIDITSPSIGECLPSLKALSDLSVGDVFQGVVRCDCPGGFAVPDAEVHLIGRGSNRGQVRLVKSDVEGLFRLDGLATGDYNVQITKANYVGVTFLARVRPGTTSGRFEARLVAEPPRERAAGWVVAATLPSYPGDARAKGEEGSIVARFSMQGDDVVDVNIQASRTSPTLASALAADLKSWRFLHVAAPVVQTEFNYRLLPGDCSADQRPAINMTLPGRVDIVAKRLVPCHPETVSRDQERTRGIARMAVAFPFR